MGKRFTETGKWTDKWYRGLSPDFKLAWNYITDCCDQAGVIDLDCDLANFQIGTSVDWNAFVEACEDRVVITRRGKWFIAGFIKFQYGKLSPDCKPHLPVIQLLEKHGIDAESVEQNQNFKYGNITPQRREKVFARDGHVCCYCGEQFAPEAMEPDHVIPVSRGGNDALGNLVAACIPCNRAKLDHHPSAFINSLPDPEIVWERLSQRVNERLYQSLKDKDKDQDKDKDKDKDQEGGVGETKPAPTLPPSIRTEAMEGAVRDWLAYKRERRESYKPTGLKAFYGHLSSAVATHGEATIIGQIRKAMASNWKGWDHADSRGSPSTGSAATTRNGAPIIPMSELKL